MDRYLKLLQLASVSADGAYREQCRSCCHFVKEILTSMGFTTTLFGEENHCPTVYGERIVDPKAPTLLLYNHYDVQPIGDLSLWKTPPFEPYLYELNGEQWVRARGALDNKGQFAATLDGVEKFLERSPSFNIKWLVDGEEEIGSPYLSRILSKKKEQLRADYLLIPDVTIPTIDAPCVTLGLRGIVAFDIKLQGSNRDLHSGLFGGVAYNPLHALAFLLATLRDERGRIQIPGFYTDVKELSSKEKDALALESFASTMTELAIVPSGGEIDYPAVERAWLRPTCEVNGIYGGHTGDGVATIIPKEATAKMTMRLVEGQSPEKLIVSLEQFLRSHLPNGITMELHIREGMGKAAQTSPLSPWVHIISQATEKVFQRPCAKILGGGSIPIAALLKEVSGAEMGAIGTGLASDGMHAPNEHFSLHRYALGRDWVQAILEEIDRNYLEGNHR